MTTYGSFPGVQVTTAGGGITAVVIGDEENLVLFGEADYDRDGLFVRTDGESADTADGLDSSTTTVSTESPEQINARNEADAKFGDDTELANAMKDALANGANIDFMYGVAPERYLREETFSGSATGTLSNVPVYEDTSEIDFYDSTGSANLDVRFVYDTNVSAPTGVSDTVNLNPHTGEFAADDSADFTVGYRSVDYDTAFGVQAVRNIVNEDETGVYCALSEADSVSSALNSEVSAQRNNYQLVNALHAAEPNSNEVSDTTVAFTNADNDPRYDTSTYSSDGNQSIDADYMFKFAPVRQEDSTETVMGGVGGLFAGNPISDPIYNDPLSGFTLDQSLSKSEANDLRDEDIIPVRQAGSVRVKDNISTSTETDWERDFWRRRITDRVILIAKTVGDSIIGRINDEDTRSAAERQIEAEMRSLVDSRLIKPNTDTEQNFFVDVYESSTDSDEVKIDVGFTPFGIVKRIDASVTIDT
jgi:hypothetical protein